MSQPLLSKAKAIKQYRLLLEGYQANNCLLDKANHVRSRIDTVLRMAYTTANPEKETSIGKISAETLVNLLLPEDQHSELRNRLHQARKLLNEKAMHRYNIETFFGMDITEKDYRDCLSAICDFIALVSSQPIPEALLQATKELIPGKCKAGARLEMIFLIQLFSSLDDIQDGVFIISKLKKMLLEKTRLGLDCLHIHLVTYSPDIQQLSPIDNSHVDETIDGENHNITARAFGQALEYLDNAIERQKTEGGEKPWLVWIASDLEKKPTTEQLQHLQQYLRNKVVGLYPMPANQQTKAEFASLWPEIRPIPIQVKLAENFFKSVLRTAQLILEEDGDEKEGK